MALVYKIGGENKEALKSIQEVSLGLKDQRAILASLQKQYAALSTEQARGKIGKEIAADIRIAKDEITRLSAASVNSFGNVGKAATGALSSIRNFAYVLPGIGVAGLIGGLADLVVGLFDASNAFSETELSAGRFNNTIKQLKEDVEDFKTSLDFEGRLKKISLEMSGLTGANLQAASAGVDIENNVKLIGDLAGKINDLTKTRDGLVKTRVEYEQLLTSFGQTSRLKELITRFGDIENLPESAVRKLAVADQEFIKKYQKATDEIKSLSKQRDAAFRGTIEGVASIGLPFIREKDKASIQKRIKETILPALGSIQLELTPILAFKVEESAIRKSVRRLEEIINKEITPKISATPLSIIPSDALSKRKEELLEFAKVAEFVGNKIADAFDAAFDALLQGQSVIKSLGESFKKLVADMIKSFARMAIIKGIASLVPGVGSLFSLFGGFRAAGGPVAAGVPYMVGERGPEIIIPSTSSRVIPNNNLGNIQGTALQPAYSERLIAQVSGQNIDIVLQRFNKYKGNNV